MKSLFCIVGSLSGESTGHWCISLTTGQQFGLGGSFADNLDELYIVDHGKGKFPVFEKYYVGVDISLYFLQNFKRVFTIKEIYLI